MNLPPWSWYAGVYALLVSTTSCRPNDLNGGLDIQPPYAPRAGRGVNGSSIASPPSTLAPFANVSSASRAPNPCIDEGFQPPVYQFSDLAVDAFYLMANFTVRDVANNYSLHCSWGSWGTYRQVKDGPDWYPQDCVPETGPIPTLSQTVTLLNLLPEYLMMNKSDQSPVRLVQYWYCDIRNMSYPQAYQSRVEVFFNVTCPDRDTAQVDQPCDVSATQLPVIVKAEWQPTGPLRGTPRLVPRSSPPAPIMVGLNPPPDKDCTDISLTHPDWELSDFFYVPQAAQLSLTLSSRPTGARVSCQFGGENTIVDNESFDLVCSPEPDQFASRSQFTVKYAGMNQELYIQEDWVCGDIHGLYSTNFSANGQLTMPTSCNNTGCVADPVTIRGSLTKPVTLTPAPIPAPPNASTPNCLANSQDLTKPLWTLTRFLYQTTNQTLTNYPIQWEGQPFPYGRTLRFSLRNEANGFTQSCDFDDPVLDGTIDRWWPCMDATPPHTFPQRAIETYFQFNRETGGLLINQTWYCNDTQEGTPFMISAHGVLPEPDSVPREVGPDYATGLVCGVSNSTALNVVCGFVPFIDQPIYCDVTLTARWCSLGGDRDGLGPALRFRATQTTAQQLAADALTAPDPVPGAWSCTAASLGASPRGPVTWALQSPDYFALTAWFGKWYFRTDQMYSKLKFDIDSSAFRDRPGGGVVHNVGTSTIPIDYEDATALTPWLRGSDPTQVYTPADRMPWDSSVIGWDFYNVLGWDVRFDLSTGYLELNHSWYCDDKDPSRPIVFNGTWNGYIPLNCSYKFGEDTYDFEYFEDGIFCLPVGGDPVVTPSVTYAAMATTRP